MRVMSILAADALWGFGSRARLTTLITTMSICSDWPCLVSFSNQCTIGGIYVLLCIVAADEHWGFGPNVTPCQDGAIAPLSHRIVIGRIVEKSVQ